MQKIMNMKRQVIPNWNVHKHAILGIVPKVKNISLLEHKKTTTSYLPQLNLAPVVVGTKKHTLHLMPSNHDEFPAPLFRRPP